MLRLLKRLLGSGPPAGAGPGAAATRQPHRPTKASVLVKRPAARQRPAAETAKPGLDTSDDSTNDDIGFDPYNTGAFNRAASWDRISKRKGR